VDVLREELGVDTTLVKGHNGIFTVAVDGEIVARKTWSGFPSEDEIVAAVAKRIGSAA
jgi:predicted Rdx family selenoprotein